MAPSETQILIAAKVRKRVRYWQRRGLSVAETVAVMRRERLPISAPHVYRLRAAVRAVRERRQA